MIVGVSGRRASGKSEVAAALAAEGWCHNTFAAKPREFLWGLNPVVTRGGERLRNVVAMYGWDACEDKYPEVCTLLGRCTGDTSRRALGADAWVDAAMRDVAAASHHVVLSDVRHPNEARAIKSRGGLVVSVVRPSLPPDTLPMPVEAFPPDWVLWNTGTLADLRDRVRDFMVVAAAAGQ